MTIQNSSNRNATKLIQADVPSLANNGSLVNSNGSLSWAANGGEVTLVYANQTPSTYTNAVYADITNFTEVLDAANAFNPTTGIYTVPSGLAGIHKIDVTTAVTSGCTLTEHRLFKNGVLLLSAGLLVNPGDNLFYGQGHWEVNLAVGDTIKVQFGQTNLGSASRTSNTAGYLSISKSNNQSILNLCLPVTTLGSYTPGSATTQTVLVPSWAKRMSWRLVGGGGSGGSGRKGAAGTARSGGGPGAHGGVCLGEALLTQLGLIPGTDSIWIAAPAAAAGAAAVTTNSTNGNLGAAGGATEIRKNNSGGALIAKAAGGPRHPTAAGTSLLTAGPTARTSWGTGVASTSGSITAQPAAAGTSVNSSSAGGTGGPITTANVAYAGGNAGAVAGDLTADALLGAVSGAINTAGASGASISALADLSDFCSGGGGGGASTTSAGGGHGGDGGYGAGGGGGGAAVDGVGNSGAGGNGGPGAAFIVFS